MDNLNQALAHLPAELPGYRRLYEALRQQILLGTLLPGMQLPSSRVLAQQLKIARNTAITAIEQLCAEGYAATRPGSGVYVLPTAPLVWDVSQTIAAPAPLFLSTRGKKLTELALGHSQRGAFASGVPDLKQFPFELWQRYVARYARNPQLGWQAYPAQGGHSELRAILVDYLRVARGISCKPTQILIVQSTQHSLQLVADLLADPNDRVWVEDPGYSGAISAFDAAGLSIVPQPLDEEGLSPLLSAWSQPPKLIYTTPSHQYPLGTVMSAARRRNLLAQAAEHQAWVIEDDYDSEFRYVGSPLVAMQALGPNQVIYLGTFSKTLFPALRIAYLVLPEHLIEAFRATQARHLREPSYVTQNALADFIRDGHVSSHIRKMRHEYQLRRDLLLQILKNGLGNRLQISGADTGIHFVLYLPPDSNDQDVVNAAFAQGINLRPLSTSYRNKTAARSGLIIGFGDVDQSTIKRTGHTLVEVLKMVVSSMIS